MLASHVHQARYYLIPGITLLSKYDRWRNVAKMLNLSKEASLRLEWIIYYEITAKKDASFTCRHFGITRKTFYKWKNRFNERNLKSLEDESRAPLRVRQREYTPLQYQRFVEIRKRYIRYGKEKLLREYQARYPEDQSMTNWKMQCMIQASGIYYHPLKQARINRKRQRARKKKKITELKRKKVSGFLLCLDTMVKYWQGKKRYILTAIDKHSKVAFARMYNTHSSYSSQDFLYRLRYLLDGRIENIQTDNGSEFAKYFDRACQKLNIPHYYSRPRTPKDNGTNERFNRTLKEEFLQLGNMSLDTVIFNRRLTEWLIEYNFRRPHQSLGYSSPINFSYKYHKVLPMYPSSTYG